MIATFGHNSGVATPVRPDLPSLVDQAIDVFGHRARVAVIRSLGRDGSATRTELSRRLDLSRSLLQAHLRAMEELDVVTTDPPRSEPGRLHRRYVLNVGRVVRLRDALAGAVTPPGSN